MIYLDYNATTPLCDAAREAMSPYLGRHFGNPSSVHAAGREARAAIARDSALKGDVAQFPKEIGGRAIEMVGKYLRKEKIPERMPVAVAVIDKAYLAKSPAGK